MSSFMGGRYTLDSISLADLSPSQTRWLGHGRGRSPKALPLRKAAGMPDPWQRYPSYAPYCVERLSGNSAENMMVAYALRHGKQEIPHGSVQRRMEVHPPTSARARERRTSQAPRPKGDPRRCLLRLEERLPLAFAASRVPALEDRLRLV